MKNLFILFTCEHASNNIPAKYQHLFKGKKSILESHRGFDWGTEKIGSALGAEFKAPVFYGKFSRLLIDLNRSEKHKTALSEMTRVLHPDEHEEIRKVYHRPHWNEVKSVVDAQIKKGKTVLHIGVHSFTPELNGIVRTTELGICYDSRRKREQAFALKWQQVLLEHTDYRVRRNYPYDGKYDGLTSSFRKLYGEGKYLGFEIEMNQSLVTSARSLNELKKNLIHSLSEIL